MMNNNNSSYYPIFSLFPFYFYENENNCQLNSNEVNCYEYSNFEEINGKKIIPIK